MAFSGILIIKTSICTGNITLIKNQQLRQPKKCVIGEKIRKPNK